MAGKTRYRTIVKVLCNDCRGKAMNSQKFDVKCSDCSWLKYNNVQEYRLRAYIDFLDKEHSNWIFCNVYYYVKGGKGELHKMYKNGIERVVP